MMPTPGGARGLPESSGSVLADLLAKSQLVSADQLPHLISDAATTLGAVDAVVYLVDLQQRFLVPFFGAAGTGLTELLEALPVDSTLAGRCYQRLEVLSHDTDVPGGGRRVWVPVLDGAERLGVLSVTIPSSLAASRSLDELEGAFSIIASLVAVLMVTKSFYGDTIIRVHRTQQMGLAAEMQWGLLPPLNLRNVRVNLAGALEPAYNVAGDSVDYAVDGDTARFAVFDGMGHGLQSAQLAALAVTAYRSARRSGRSLAETVRYVDQSISALYVGDAFTTAVFAELDVSRGQFSWANAGHPAPLLLRGRHVVRSLAAEPGLPCGLQEVLAPNGTTPVSVRQLEPGDHVLLYTDGLVEARSPAGIAFGLDRLCETVNSCLARGLSNAETTRVLVRDILAHQQGQLDDDATVLFAQWLG